MATKVGKSAKVTTKAAPKTMTRASVSNKEAGALAGSEDAREPVTSDIVESNIRKGERLVNERAERGK